jgi:hypothetical protein
MHTIFKQKLEIEDIQTVQLPSDFNILHLGVQQGVPTFWYECNTGMPLVKLNIYCFGTGYVMDNLPALIYIGTVQIDGFVWHYYRTVEWKEIKEG